MTTIYIENKKKKEQIVKLSDGTYGVMTAMKEKGGLAYKFSFTAHLHPNFLMTHAPIDGDVENVHSIDGEQRFKIQWLSKH